MPLFLISDLDRVRRSNYSEEAEKGIFDFGSAKIRQFSVLTVSSVEVERATTENTSKTSKLRTSTAVTLNMSHNSCEDESKPE